MTQLVAAREVKAVAVIGAGTMGHGIAHVAALAGYSVTLFDVRAEALEAARSRIEKNLRKGVDKGKLDADAPAQALARLRTTTSLGEAAEGADVVIEAVPESLELKARLFAELSEHAPVTALLATNTSSISVAAIAPHVSAPERLVGMHFFNPVHIMKLVEVIHHEGSSPEAVALARALAERFGKQAITVKDAPGFASSRLGVAIGLEAMRMVEQGVASPADIDTAMRLGYGFPMGPLELTDLIGLDTRLGIAEYLEGELGAVFAVPKILRDKVAAGQLGKKSGEGFYRWEGDRRA
jgi:3-hydroxybutyryl-CoA dehydrogenase